MGQSQYQIGQQYLLGSLLFICILLLFILVLLRNVIQRKKAEREVEEAKDHLQGSYQELAATHAQLLASEQELHRQFLELQTNREALRLSRERYRLAMEGSEGGIWDWDFGEKKIFISTRGRNMIDLSHTQTTFNYEVIMDQVYPEDLSLTIDVLKSHLQQRTPYFRVEQRMKTKTGEYQWFNIRGKAIFDTAGQPLRMAGSITNIQEHKQAEAKIKYMAYYDELTGLPNRALFFIKLREALEQREKTNGFVGIFFLDIDTFKAVNDSIGHQYGDQLLQRIAILLKTYTGTDLCARVGGDGFIIIRSDLQSKEDAITIAQDIIHAFDQPFSLQEREIYLSISMGIAVAPEDGTDADTLFKNADSVMYSLKKAGQNTYRLYDQEVHLESLQKIEMERELRKALEREELELYYQPQVDLKGDYITGAEALIRWNHPTKGQIPPGKFISLAEQTGLIIPIGEWVIEEACRQMKEWKEKKLGIQYLAINLSGRQFQDRNLIDNINEKIEKYGLNPSDLELEITETIAMENLEYAIATLESLENMGFNISLDDFGTGYSSMNYLKHLPISTVKIDRSFLEDIMEGDEGERAIIEAVIALAHANQLKVVAEGIETNEQLEFLRAQNCDKGQGYLFSRPLSVSALEKLLQKRAKLYE
mgnify:FL=1